MRYQLLFGVRGVAFAMVLLLVGCTHAPVTNIGPVSVDVAKQDGVKISGNYVLFVKTDMMQGNSDAATPICSGHVFPYDVGQAYSEIVLNALKTKFQNVELVESYENMESKKYDAAILINTVDMSSWFRVISGIWSSDVMVFSSIISEVVVLSEEVAYSSPVFRVLNNHRGPLGYPCSRIPEAVGASIGKSSHESAMTILEVVEAIFSQDEFSRPRNTSVF